MLRCTPGGKYPAISGPRPQTQPVTFTKPTSCFAAVAATDASVCSSASEALAVQVRIVAPDESRQSAGMRCWCGESPITIVVAEKRLTRPIIADTACTALAGCGSSAQLAAISVTCG